VLRSLRYGEADRILHLYTRDRGRVGAIAKGVRRARSRFGGRLEPFFRLDIELHEGRSELMTVTGAQTRDGYAAMRADGAALDAASRSCDAVLRLFDTGEGHADVFNLLCNRLALLAAPSPADRACASAREGELAFRLKLMHAAGLAPQLAACATCGEREHLVGFSGAAGGVVCAACEAGSFPIDEQACSFMVAALGSALRDVPRGEARHLAQAERAISVTLEHHANVRLIAAAA